MGCCGKNSDDGGRSDNMEMDGAKGGKNGGGKWGKLFVQDCDLKVHK